MARIQQHDPVLRAFANLEPERVRSQAEAAEAAVVAGQDLGLLHGVPIAVKSHIDIEGLSRPGFVFWHGVAKRDDLTVERLRAAGAVIFGHTVMPVMNAQGEYDWDALARNPWDLSRVPGASSSGSGAAVAAGLLPVALGSDGAGSSRLPAAYCGIVGVHPTGGLVPWVDHRAWAVRIGTTIGPMARTVHDAAAVLSVIAGPDGRDHMGLKIELADPRSELELGAAGLRLAWTDDFGFSSAYGVEESTRVVLHIREAAFALRDWGAAVEETEERWEDYREALNVHRLVFSDMPILGPESGASVPEEAWQAASEFRQRTYQRFVTLFEEFDLLLCPTIQTVAPTVERWRQWWSGPTDMPSGRLGMDGYAINTAMFNWLAFPAVSVPCGLVDGLPVGLQIVGPPGADARVLRFACAFCDAFPLQRHPPL
jgi:aspartyl-tRNA(Asn)/glutamyl-tRNA(Gln) amidotransferase subunit A